MVGGFVKALLCIEDFFKYVLLVETIKALYSFYMNVRNFEVPFRQKKLIGSS